MASLLRMPEISANTVEAVLAVWLLEENAEFSAGDAIATVETEKAVVDVPAESDGVLLRTLIEPGRSVPVGTPLAVLGAPGEAVHDLDELVEKLTGAPRTAAIDEAAANHPSPAGSRDVGQAAGEGTPAAGTEDRTAIVGAAPAHHVASVTAGNGTGPAGPGGGGAAGRIFASPLARRLARENGLDIADLHGTGPGGRIVRDDVRHALAAHGDAGFEDVPHSRMRRAIANRLAQSSRETPVFSIRGTARVDALLALRRDLNDAATVKISVNDLIVAAAARAHIAVPEMNVVWTPDAVRRFRDVDIAVAVATDTGLVAPVVRGVPRLTVSALAARTADLAARAREGRLRQDELEGGALTVTNLGAYGTEDFTAVINPPQAAILAVGAARQEAVVTDGQLGVATVLRVTLSVDHRPVDGATGARWMAAFLALLEAPLRILI